MIISFVAAMGRNKAIGKDNSLPWKLPADMKHFKDLTKGKPVIMGRKTYESIGKPLPNRKNIILTRDKNYKSKQCIVVHSVEEALSAAGSSEEAMVIGGSQVYHKFLPRTNKMYLTIIGADFEGDAYFPDYDKRDWKETHCEKHNADEENKFSYTFLTLERKK